MCSNTASPCRMRRASTAPKVPLILMHKIVPAWPHAELPLMFVRLDCFIQEFLLDDVRELLLNHSECGMCMQVRAGLPDCAAYC